MLSVQTERLFSDYLYQIGVVEQDVEAARQDLCNNLSYAPKNMFPFLDKSGYGIASFDLKDFTDTMDTAIPVYDFEYVVDQYDGDRDGRLSYDEFLQFTLPKTHRELAVMTETRNSLITPGVHDLMYALLNAEIEGQKQILQFKAELLRTYDFSFDKGFNLLDARANAFIDKQSLIPLLKRHDHRCTKNVLNAIMRRLGGQGSAARVRRFEFVQCLTGARGLQALLSSKGPKQRMTSPRKSRKTKSKRPATAKKSKLRRSSKAREGSPARSPLRHSTSLLQSAPLRSSLDYTSPLRSSFRQTSPLRQSESFLSPLARSGYVPSLRESASEVRASPLKSSLRSSSPLRASALLQSPARPTVLFPAFSEADIAHKFKQQIDLDSMIETAKIDLAMQPDFNLYDIYQMLDTYGKGYINTVDLDAFLKRMRVPGTFDEAHLILRRYADGQDIIKSTPFGELFLPKDPEFRIRMRGREFQNRRCFELRTEEKLSHLIKLHIDAENLAEGIREIITSSGQFDARDLFHRIDRNGKGVLGINEFQDLLRFYGIPATFSEVDSLAKRYDANKDGIVSYSDFLNEVEPKSPYKL